MRMAPSSITKSKHNPSHRGRCTIHPLVGRKEGASGFKVHYPQSPPLVFQYHDRSSRESGFPGSLARSICSFLAIELSFSMFRQLAIHISSWVSVYIASRFLFLNRSRSPSSASLPFLPNVSSPSFVNVRMPKVHTRSQHFHPASRLL